MEKLIKEQKRALKELGDRLSKRFIAARLTEDGTALTVLLPEIIKGKDLFCDVLFLPQQEGMEGNSFASFRTIIEERADIETENALGFCRRLSEINDTLFIGGYGLELIEDTVSFGQLIFSATVPMIPDIEGKNMADMLEDALTLYHGDLEDSLNEIMS